MSGRKAAIAASLLLSGIYRFSTTGGSSSATPAPAECKLRQRWNMLLAVSLCTATNAFICMTFSVMESLTAEAFNLEKQQVASLYTIWLATVAAGLTVGTLLTDRFEGLAICMSATMNMASVAIRVTGIYHQSHLLIIGSQILCGIGAWPIFTLPGEVSHRYFPEAEQPLATCIMWQANYFGWMLGLFWPLFFTTVPGLLPLFGIEAAVSIICSLAALLCWTSAKRIALRGDGVDQSSFESHGLAGFLGLFQNMAERPSFAVELLAHGLHGGVSFAIPSVLFFILSRYGFSVNYAAAANGVFILSGNLCGTFLGKVCTNPSSFHGVLKVCYAVTLTTLLTLAVMGHTGQLDGNSMCTSLQVLLLCGACGASSLGFVGIGVESAALYGVNEAYVGWFREFIVLGSAAFLSYMAVGANGFQVLFAAAALCSLLLILGLKPIREGVKARVSS